MKILKLLNKKYLLIILTFFFLFVPKLYSDDEPVDIWNLEKKVEENSNEDFKNNNDPNETKIELNSFKIVVTKSIPFFITFWTILGSAGAGSDHR